MTRILMKYNNCQRKQRGYRQCTGWVIFPRKKWEKSLFYDFESSSISTEYGYQPFAKSGTIYEKNYYFLTESYFGNTTDKMAEWDIPNYLFIYLLKQRKPEWHLKRLVYTFLNKITLDISVMVWKYFWTVKRLWKAPFMGSFVNFILAI